MLKARQYFEKLFRCGILAGLLFLGCGIFAQEVELEKIALAFKDLASKKIDRPKDYSLACDWDLLQLKLKKVQFLLQFYKPSKEMADAADSELKNASMLLDALEKKKAMQAKSGIAEEAYFDDIDASPQPFIRYLPESYDKKNKYPLIVYLHGYSPYLNIVNWTELPEGITDLADKVNACVVMPFARSNTDFQGIGEKDVLNVIEQMKKRYSIDEDRIILSGMSMGGMGVWTIGSHYPHLFAGLLIVSGRGDFYFWHKLNRDSFPEWKQWLIDREFAASHLQNLRQLPIRVFHGTDDTLINITEARHMNELLSPGNTLFKYQEVEGGDHWIHEKVFVDKDLIEWIKNARRKSPESFEYITYAQAYHQAFWLDITRFLGVCQPANIKVEVKDGKVMIKTTGVAELVLDRNKMPERSRKFEIVKQGDFKLDETRDIKNSGTSYDWGPVKDDFLEPFMFVNAGMKDSDFLQRVFDWSKFAKSLPRMKNEKDLTENDKKSYNLFLYGEPETSPLIAEVLKSSPVKITADEIQVGDKKFPREGKGVYLKYLSPWAPPKSVVVQCGIPWGNSCSDNHKYDFLPGYAIYSGESDPTDPFGCNKVLLGGFFNKEEKLSP